MYRVMLVEDDEVVRYVYSKMKAWENNGFVIQAEAANGIHALEALKSNPVDVVFTDIRMPLMNGIDFMKAAKEENPGLLFVLISSYNEFEYAREGLRAGAVDYLVKPMEEKQLEETLVRLTGMMEDQIKEPDLQWLEPIFAGEAILQDPLVQDVCKYLEKNIHGNISMEEVSSAMHLNKDYMGKQIKSKTGYSFRSLYHQVKMQYAKPLIRSARYKVYEISDLLGYANVDAFTAQFKSIEGITPMEYRKKIPHGKK